MATVSGGPGDLSAARASSSPVTTGDLDYLALARPELPPLAALFCISVRALGHVPKLPFF